MAEKREHSGEIWTYTDEEGYKRATYLRPVIKWEEYKTPFLITFG